MAVVAIVPVVLLLGCICMCTYVDAGLEIDQFAYCLEPKEAIFTGTGGRVRIEVEGDGIPAIVTKNTIDPLYRGGFEFVSKNASPVSEYMVEFTVNVYYNMTPELSGREITLTASGGDTVTGKTTIRSGECSFAVDWTRQNNKTYFVSWEQPNCSGWTDIAQYIVTLECGCDIECILNETLSTKSTSASFDDLPTGLCRVSITAVNECREETTEKRKIHIESNSSVIIHTFHGYIIFFAMLAVVVALD